ncbi:hypothetical protein HYH02_013425 [Chlamydomonas schloesseri]|uniref:Uncharacterized protein n=1 Tax=Chlamydomonas schloesseri TaxID=2026947 RepID=A0A835VZE5_9CHLO|nr:hypothetical protein HYH02_013425 [Chlamydomonas schloesseri]|eukprot:KAG2431294.1 hypothetical protein HYH02_013425 [Chlamydomonas schloesseri]
MDSTSHPSTSESVAPCLPAAGDEDFDTFARFGPSRPSPFAQGDSLLPQLCATPKKKLSLHRRGNRRVWYWLKRKTEYAKCSYCGALAGRNHMFSGAAGNGACTGQCVEQPAAPPTSSYPAEYKPPC